MKRNILTIMKWSFEIALVMLISFIYYLNMIVVTPTVVYIPSGSIDKIITQLSRQNYNVTKLDALILRFLGSPQKGWIYIGSEKVTRADFLYRLTTAKAATEDVTLIPGETTYIFLNQLSESLKLDRELLQKYYDRYSKYKEGEFVPNTYKLPIGISEENLIKTLLAASDRQMRELSFKIFGKYDKDRWFRYVTVASIIQKEAASIEEMPLVSSVIYNRIKKGMKLQMDGSLNYGEYSHIKITHKRIMTDKSSYNTYLYRGIPDAPVCNVSIEAIKAAIFPAKTSYLYFVKAKNNRHVFSCNYSTHIKNINNATK
ncbi:endolytic transglycosylase MltG [Sulfurimonas sp. HSL-1716]|uniref:endolytic transglycosylase MltG n=1 Tax=Hydrocurvibacter sulfurireducens TaxID=3131937 RepID=UPI0031F7ADF8